MKVIVYLLLYVYISSNASLMWALNETVRNVCNITCNSTSNSLLIELPTLNCPERAKCVELVDIYAKHKGLKNDENGHSSKGFPTFSFNISDIYYESEEIKWMMASLNSKEIVNIVGYSRQNVKFTCDIGILKQSLSSRYFRFMWNRFGILGWLGFNPWEKEITSSDGRRRMVWLKNFERLSTAYSDNRLKIIGDKLYIFRLKQNEDDGLYTCWRIDESVTRQAKHFRLQVEQYHSSWFDSRNPLTWLKWTILVSYIFFILIAYRNYLKGEFAFQLEEIQEKIKKII